MGRGQDDAAAGRGAGVYGQSHTLNSVLCTRIGEHFCLAFLKAGEGAVWEGVGPRPALVAWFWGMRFTADDETRTVWGLSFLV